MSVVKRLTPPQDRKINALVRRTCCKRNNRNCILLDDGDEYVCPKPISYSLLCKWFRGLVLPADKLLYAELYQTGNRKKCIECGASFVSSSNSVKYYPDYWKRIIRRQTAERKRKRYILIFL
ncbi:conjugal transfer protein [Clostridiales bacterium COT073_COT-073]|nr:conjugal transfer protein [Clostridiales bacterium COT073_COT-073]